MNLILNGEVLNVFWSISLYILGKMANSLLTVGSKQRCVRLILNLLKTQLQETSVMPSNIQG